MQFVSRFNREPFSRFSYYAKQASNNTKPLTRKTHRPANKMLAETFLQDRLYSHKDLMFDYNFEAILDKKTGNPFTGKFIIDSDGTERICDVKLGEIRGNLVRFKPGVNYHAERGTNSKYFKVNLPESEIQQNTEKLLEADQKAFDEMVKSFAEAQEANPNRFFGYNA